MKKIIFIISMPVLCLFLLTACVPHLFVTSGADGVWYEQNENGGTLTVQNSTMIYESPYFTAETAFSLLNTETGAELVPDEDWYFIDIFYDAVEDSLTAHDLPHTDGDGGYHLITFARTRHVAPPEPVYGERIDNSDPDAVKEAGDYTLKSLSFNVYEPWRDSGDMAPELPDQGEYSYGLIVNEDGSGQLSSDFCQEIKVSENDLEALYDLIKTSSLMEINGLDIITEEMPEDTERYELDMEFASGEKYHSRANGKDVPEVWRTDGRTLHKFIFELFITAGYNPSTGEFHSSDPILRIGPGPDDRCSYSVTVEDKRIEEKGKAYDYTVYSEYPVFSVEGDAPDALIAALNSISDHYKKCAEDDFEYEYALMESVPESTWEKEEHRTTYSFYATIHERADDTKYYFWIDEGHSNCFGLGEHGVGDYSYTRYCIDAESGKIMSLSDFFTNDDMLLERFTALLAEYNESDDHSTYLYSDAYQEKLLTALTNPEADGGIGFEPLDDGIAIYVSDEFDDVLFYPYGMKLYYEDVQDIMNERYSELRGI